MHTHIYIDELLSLMNADKFYHCLAPLIVIADCLDIHRLTRQLFFFFKKPVWTGLSAITLGL